MPCSQDLAHACVTLCSQGCGLCRYLDNAAVVRLAGSRSATLQARLTNWCSTVFAKILQIQDVLCFADFHEDRKALLQGCTGNPPSLKSPGRRQSRKRSNFSRG
eukprot:6488616-Amphidinium_carterae.1